MPKEKGPAKYLILKDDIKQDIMSGIIKPGDKIASENELALQYDVSRHTVRKALSILQNEGYLETEHGRGTYCKESLRTQGRTNDIAVITTYISDYIFPRLISGIDTVLAEEGYSILLKNTGNSQQVQQRILEEIIAKKVDGIIIEPSKSEIFCSHESVFKRLDQLKIPYVFLQGIYPQMKDAPHILMDDEKGAYLLTKYLIEQGHRNIVGIFKIDDMQGGQRNKGYSKALMEARMMYDPENVILFHTEDRQSKPTGMIEAFIKEKKKMDAIVCYNDEIALEIIQVLMKYGIRVPEDISITGYDDSILAESGPVKLTTIAHPKERLGQMAAKLLIEKINGVSDSESKVERLIEPKMVIRDSCRSRKV
ncbi:transcriptional repressor of arabinoside utilization operon, GntR family [Lachnospiraceae bacterium KM106-2]|nr:transcriptional repressor of arabinoside utilization operon, GntR family [Lachnospiraceae bacterium KM106-2]